MPKVQVGANVLPVLGIVLLVLPAYFIARWIRIVNEVSGHDDRVAEFGLILPGVLQGPLASTLFALGIVKLTLRPAQCRDEHSPAPLPSASLSARNHQPCRLALPQILHELPGC